MDIDFRRNRPDKNSILWEEVERLKSLPWIKSGLEMERVILKLFTGWNIADSVSDLPFRSWK